MPRSVGVHRAAPTVHHRALEIPLQLLVVSRTYLWRLDPSPRLEEFTLAATVAKSSSPEPTTQSPNTDREPDLFKDRLVVGHESRHYPVEFVSMLDLRPMAAPVYQEQAAVRQNGHRSQAVLERHDTVVPAVNEQ
jgi:hypothetical protein